MESECPDNPGTRPGPEESPVLTRHDWNNNLEVATSVVQAVAAATEEEPAELPPLVDGIDPDALEGLVDSLHERGAGSVRFAFNGCRVTVDGSGTIEVRPR